MAGHLLFNSGSNESSLDPQFKWLDNTFKLNDDVTVYSPTVLDYFLCASKI
jgi:hypothetical protein